MPAFIATPMKCHTLWSFVWPECWGQLLPLWRKYLNTYRNQTLISEHLWSPCSGLLKQQVWTTAKQLIETISGMALIQRKALYVLNYPAFQQFWLKKFPGISWPVFFSSWDQKTSQPKWISAADILKDTNGKNIFQCNQQHHLPLTITWRDSKKTITHHRQQLLFDVLITSNPQCRTTHTHNHIWNAQSGSHPWMQIPKLFQLTRLKTVVWLKGVIGCSLQTSQVLFKVSLKMSFFTRFMYILVTGT